MQARAADLQPERGDIEGLAVVGIDFLQPSSLHHPFSRRNSSSDRIAPRVRAGGSGGGVHPSSTHTSFACALALLFAGCGTSPSDSTTGAGPTGATGPTSGAGAAASTSAATSTGTGGGSPQPPATLCDEVTVSSWSCTPNNYHDPLVSFVANSSLVFRGTVTALHDTTPGINLADKTRAIIVHVDTVLFDGGMPGIGGQSVTVVLLAAPTMAVGYDGYFFTSLWTLKQSIGVTEVAHIDPGVYPTIESDVPGIEQLLADERLYARMQTAGTVLVGTVEAIMPLTDTGPVSEHDPIWAEATITTECILRGAKPSSTHIAFATSEDIAWFDSPKLTAGQRGVFLLQPSPSPPGPWPIPEPIAYVISHRLDVNPPEERAHIATLVLCPPSR